MLKGLDKGGSEAAHVTYHDLDTGLISRFDDRLSLLTGQAHRFLNENMLPLANGSEGRIGMIFIAVQHEDRAEIPLSGQIIIVGVTMVSRHVVALSHCGEQFLRNVADGSDLKLV